FQAEDGIRDFHVTGVQTYALPISAERQLCEQLGVSRSSLREAIQQLITAGIIQSKAGAGTYLKQLPAHWSQYQIVEPLSGLMDRSEERRVGKECRCAVTKEAYKKA